MKGWVIKLHVTIYCSRTGLTFDHKLMLIRWNKDFSPITDQVELSPSLLCLRWRRQLIELSQMSCIHSLQVHTEQMTFQLLSPFFLSFNFEQTIHNLWVRLLNLKSTQCFMSFLCLGNFKTREAPFQRGLSRCGWKCFSMKRTRFILANVCYMEGSWIKE